MREAAVACFVLAIFCGGAPSLALVLLGLAAVLLLAAWWP